MSGNDDVLVQRRRRRQWRLQRQRQRQVRQPDQLLSADQLMRHRLKQKTRIVFTIADVVDVTGLHLTHPNKYFDTIIRILFS